MEKSEQKVPWLDHLALTLAKFYFRKDRANAREVRSLAEQHTNPAPLLETFESGNSIPTDPGGGETNSLWDFAYINGSSRVLPPPHGEAGSILVENGVLKLQVRQDPSFDSKSARWKKGVPAAEQYNNAYMIGMAGFLPTPERAVRIDCRMRISPGFHGSTGFWVEEENTFDPKTGIMITPFRSFGFSYLGDSSDVYIRGLAAETVLGLSIQGKKTIHGIDVSQWHTYTMKWSWAGERQQKVEFTIDEDPVAELRMHPFGPSEVQLWADNYQIGRGLKIGYLNVPDTDETLYDWIRVEEVPG